MQKRKTFKRLLVAAMLLFALMNFIAFFHARKFTHFSSDTQHSLKNESQLSFSEKISALVFGVSTARPENKAFPVQDFKPFLLQSNKKIECWHIQSPEQKGTVILFHGYKGTKSTMLDKSDELLKMGYSTLVVDFMGSGGSEGNQCTIGYREAEQVKSCYDYLRQQGETNIFLFGNSMGAAAVLKALHDYDMQPAGAIVECPFGSMYATTCARFRNMGVPCFPMAGLLVFWGGVQNGFNAFSHNPEDYALDVHCPVLLLFGEQDDKVSRKETDTIFRNLKGKKTLKTYPLAGHENFLLKYKQEWVNDVLSFLEAQ